MARGNIKKNYILNVINQLCNILAPLVTTPYVSRVLGVEGVGQYSFAESVASYFVILAILGTGTYAQREISYLQDDKAGRSRIFYETVILRCMSTVVSLALYAGTIAFGVSGKTMLVIMAVNVFAVAFDITWFFQGMEDFGKIVCRNLCFRILNIIYIFLWVKTSEDLFKFAVGTVVLNLMGYLSMWFYMPIYITPVKLTDLRPFRDMRVIFSLFIPTIAIQIYTIFDKTMLGFFTETAVENGCYEQSMKIVRAMEVIVTSLGAVMAPRIGYFFARGENEKVKDYMYTAYRFVWAIAVPLALGTIGISDNIVPWYLGPGFEKSGALLKVLPFLAVIIGMSNVTGIQYLIPTKRQNLLTKTVVTGAVINFCLNLILIPRCYSVGAAVSSVIAELIITSMQVYYVKGELDVRRVICSGKNYLVAGLLMMGLLLFMNGHLSPSIIHSIEMTVSGAIVYAVVLFCMRDELFMDCVQSVLKRYRKGDSYKTMEKNEDAGKACSTKETITEAGGDMLKKGINFSNSLWKLTSLQEYYILFLIFIISFTNQLGLTTFYCNPWRAVYKPVYVLTLLVVLSKIPFVYKKREFWFSIPAAAVFYMAFSLQNYKYQVFLAPLLIGCIGINYRKIFCAAFIPSIYVLINMMLSALSGGINNIVYWSRNIRSSWGNLYPTDFATAVLFAVVFLWLLFKNLQDEIFIIPSLFSLYISFCITKSFTSTYLTILFMAMLLARAFGRRVIDKKEKLKWIYKITNTMMMIAFPLFGAAILAGVYAYYKEVPFARTIDTLLHGRFIHPARMYAEYGLKPFGTFFEMVGNGGSSIANYGDRNFIDSTYAQIFVRNGWATYIVANVLWIYTMAKAIKAGNRRIAYAMTLLSCNFIMEHHWFEINYNIFTILPFAGFADDVDWKVNFKLIKDFRDKWKDQKYVVVFSVSGCMITGLLYLLLPVVFSWNRTIITGFGLSGGGWRGVVVFFIISLLILIFGFLIYSLCDKIALALSSRKPGKNGKRFFITVVIVTLCAVGIINLLVQKIVNRETERINAEREVLELITQNAEGDVYAGKLPEAYIRNLSGISRSYYSGDDYGRYDTATIIADASWDSRPLTGKGFLYLEISDEDAIYTNDVKVTEALRKEGYVLKGYNDHVYELDVSKIGNGAVIEEPKEGIVNSGNYARLIWGESSIDLNIGKFTANYDITVSKKDTNLNKKVCSLMITSYDGEKEVAHRDVFISDLDEEGNTLVEVPFNGGGQKYDFNISPEDNVKCTVKGVSYRRTPDTDVHIRVDSEGRTIHEEYYNMDGTPKQMSEGYFGMEYAYDDRDLQIMKRYLGSDFKPMCISSGYAEAHREYDVNKRLIRESYFGVDGKAINLPAGQHEVVKDYDFTGNVIEESYYDIEEQPVIYNNAFYKIKRVFDDRHCTHEEYYGTDGELIAQAAGHAGMDREFDEDGNVVHQVFLGTDLKPVVIDKGYAEVRKEYNKDKCVTSESYYGAQGEKILLNDKYFKVKRAFDDKKQCLMQMYYGTDEKPILVNGGYAGYEQSLDERGNVIHRIYLGMDGKPVMTDWGYSIWRGKYNEKKQVIREEYYDVNDEKITRPGGQFAMEHEFDNAGNCISDMYYGIDDQKILVNGAFWKVLRTYDENKMNIHEGYFGTDGKLILVSGKYAMIDFVYNESGKLVKKILKDTAGVVVEEQAVE